MRALAPDIRPRRHSAWRDVDDATWQSWRWQQANRLRDLESLEAHMTLTDDERQACTRVNFPIGITPYYFCLIDQDDPNCPIRRQAIPTIAELEVMPDELADPLAEEDHMPVEGLTHRYPDRALLYTTHNCPVYCRHCNRRRKVGDPASAPTQAQLAQAVDYLRHHPEVRDVLVSGGDPLSLSNARLAQLLAQLRQIPHLEIIRLATRNPVTLPQRIDGPLLEILSTHHPIFVNTHFNHIKECTPEAGRALEDLADAGCVVGNQMVLLKGINDDPQMVKTMYQWLLRHRCRPYYIFQSDAAEGISHFRTPVKSGLAILEQLRGWTSGLAVPHYVVDLPEGGGKVTLAPDYLVEQNGSRLTFRNYAGSVYNYDEGSE